jgi:predicted transposase YbfD/YdcC
MAQRKTRSLVEYLSEIEDRRRGNGKRHELVEVLVIALCAIFANVEGFEDMAEWARKKEAWLRGFLVLQNGIPSHDTFNRIFRILDPKQFEQVFRRWVGGVVGALRENVAIDGKALRGSATAGDSAVHMVSAFATRLGLVLGQEKVADKSNEITAIPKLLEALAIKGCLVSIDAMGTQREIARSIRALGAHYLLAVKANQPTLHEALQGAFVGQWDEVHKVVQTGHGRHVFQIVRTLPNTGQVDTATWVDCALLGRVDSVRVVNGEASPVETRYYIASEELTTEAFGCAVRDHWGIENRLHWSLDVIFGEDDRRLVKDHAPQNFSLLSKMALNLLRQDSPAPSAPKKSLRLRRKSIGWDDDARMALLGLTPL